MNQIEENKKDLWETMEQLGSEPLNLERARNLGVLMDAYKALCLISGEEHAEGGAVAIGVAGGFSMTKQEAESWVSRMKNADGSVGAHWALDQTEQVRTQHGIDCDPMKFWVAMNMMYSDYCKVAKKNNVSTLDFFVDMAKALLDDADAQPDKLARYWKYVAER